MSKRMVRLNEIMLFGTRRVKREQGFDACVEMCRHLHPEGHWSENYMTEDEATQTAMNDEIPDSVLERAREERLNAD